MADLVTVMNRSAGKIIYIIPDKGIRRELGPNQTIKVPKDEIDALSYTAGGLDLIKNYLYVNDENLLDNLNVKREPEYYMDTSKVIDLLQNGTLDEFLDALDFAPDGVIDMIKDLSVQLPLNDYSKRKALQDKTGFNVDAAIANDQANKASEEDTPAVEEEKKIRRVQSTTPTRRTSGAKIIKTAPKASE